MNGKKKKKDRTSEEIYGTIKFIPVF